MHLRNELRKQEALAASLRQNAGLSLAAASARGAAVPPAPFVPGRLEGSPHTELARLRSQLAQEEAAANFLRERLQSAPSLRAPLGLPHGLQQHLQQHPAYAHAGHAGYAPCAASAHARSLAPGALALAPGSAGLAASPYESLPPHARALEAAALATAPAAPLAAAPAKAPRPRGAWACCSADVEEDDGELDVTAGAPEAFGDATFADARSHAANAVATDSHRQGKLDGFEVQMPDVMFAPPPNLDAAAPPSTAAFPTPTAGRPPALAAPAPAPERPLSAAGSFASHAEDPLDGWAKVGGKYLPPTGPAALEDVGSAASLAPASGATGVDAGLSGASVLESKRQLEELYEELHRRMAHHAEEEPAAAAAAPGAQPPGTVGGTGGTGASTGAAVPPPPTGTFFDLPP